MNKPRRFFSKKEQRENFLNPLIVNGTTKITDRGLEMAKKLGCESKYRKIINDNQIFLNFFGNKEKKEVKSDVVVKELDLDKNSSKLDEADVSFDIAENLEFYNKNGNKGEIHPNLQEYVEELENIFQKKASESVNSLGGGPLTEEDLKNCFDLACKEFSSFHPGRNHTYLFSLVFGRLF